MFNFTAPAKINLSLRILGRRGDGFHEIATRMTPLELADEVTVQTVPGPDGAVHFTCDDASIPGGESNLAVKAVRALESFTGPLPALHIHLEKHIPHGAGLGGGSSDAAAVLRALKAVLGLNVSLRTLLDAAGKVGSDVPFFLLGGVCDCSGRGEQVSPSGVSFSGQRVLLVKPPFGIPTPWAYQAWRDSLEVPGLPYGLQTTPAGELINDLERPVFEKYPVLGTLKAALLAAPGVQGALMSGSGSTVFALLEEDADAAPLLPLVKEHLGEEVWHSDTRLG
jgi:4-diphosphocytidyl-2-C-methyl-D-erythritol kinase